MSFSTASQTPVDSGECVVCGQVATTRCSSCATYGTGWMYFCSRDHQKLIWFAHKRVCGVNSNPFQWPFLSNEERLEMLRLRDVQLEQGEPKEDLWETHLKDKGFSLERYLILISEDFPAKTARMKKLGSPLITGRALNFDREMNLKQPKVFDPASTEHISKDPFGVLAAMIHEGWGNLVNLEDKHEWWSRLHHRLIIFVAINCSFYKRGEHPDPEDAYYEYARMAVVGILEHKAAVEYHDQALKLATTMERLVVCSPYLTEKRAEQGSLQ